MAASVDALLVATRRAASSERAVRETRSAKTWTLTRARAHGLTHTHTHTHTHTPGGDERKEQNPPRVGDVVGLNFPVENVDAVVVDDDEHTRDNGDRRQHYKACDAARMVQPRRNARAIVGRAHRIARPLQWRHGHVNPPTTAHAHARARRVFADAWTNII